MNFSQKMRTNPPPQFDTVPFSPSYRTAKGVIGRKKPVTAVCTLERKFSHSYENRKKQASFMRTYREKIHPAQFLSLLNTCASIASLTLKEKFALGSPPPTYRALKKDKEIYVRDKFGLPILEGNKEHPDTLKRKRFLEKLSVRDRNLLLTGDPLFQFDPCIYDCIFFLPKYANHPLLQNQFPYLNPEIIVVAPSEASSDSDSDYFGNLFDSDPNFDSDPEYQSAQDSDFNPDYQTAQDSDPSSNPKSDQDSDPHYSPTAGQEITRPPLTEDEVMKFLADSSSESDEACAPPTVIRIRKPPPSPPQPPPPGSPSRTRSGRPYAGESSTPAHGTTSGASSSFLSRAGRIAGQLLDSHPLSLPRAKPNPKTRGERK